MVTRIFIESGRAMWSVLGIFRKNFGWVRVLLSYTFIIMVSCLPGNGIIHTRPIIRCVCLLTNTTLHYFQPVDCCINAGLSFNYHSTQGIADLRVVETWTWQALFRCVYSMVSSGVCYPNELNDMTYPWWQWCNESSFPRVRVESESACLESESESRCVGLKSESESSRFRVRVRVQAFVSRLRIRVPRRKIDEL